MIKFGTSGWRGIIARDFTFDNVRLATQGIADFLKSEIGNRKFTGASPWSFLATTRGFWGASFHWPPLKCSPPTG
jgi:hypothetical protein